MNFDPLSFVIGKHGDSGPVRDVVSYLIGRAVGTAGEVWQTLIDVAVATFTAVSTSLRELMIDVTPVQSGSGDPSPTNVRPISGWTGANINLTKTIGVTPNPACAWSIETATLQVIGRTIRRDYIANTASNDKFVSSAALSQAFIDYDNLPAGTYAFRGELSSNRQITELKAVLKKSGASDIQIYLNGDAVSVPDGYSLNSVIFSSLAFNQGDWSEIRNFVFAIEPNVHLVSWQSEAGTVYGGTLTDNGNGTWVLKARPYYSSYNGETLVGPWVSSMDVYAPGTTPTTGAQVVDLGGIETTYTLTADSVQALIGQNNIFADCGNINTITYRES